MTVVGRACPELTFAERRKLLSNHAAQRFRAYLITGADDLFNSGWESLNALGHDIGLRREPTVENAKSLLWIAEHRQ